MPNSDRRREKKDKYSSAIEPTFMVHKGQKVVFGAPEMLRHCDWQWHRYLEQLVNNPGAPNPLELHQNAYMRKGLKDRGYIGMSQDQLRAESARYAKKLEAGEEPYSDRELYRVGYLNDKGEMIDSQTGEVIPFVPVGSAN